MKEVKRGVRPSGLEKRFGHFEAALCGRGVNNIFGSVPYESTKLEALGLAKDPPGWNDPNVAIPTVKEAEVFSPANMISFSDSVWRLTPRKDHVEGLLVPPHTGDEPGYPHRDAVQVVFLDSHVEALRRKRFLNPTEEFWRQWNRDHEPHPESWKK